MSGLTWRPSMLKSDVSHLVANDTTTHTTPERFGDAEWAYAACGQNTSAVEDEAWWMSRCLECLSWLQKNRRGTRQT